MRLDFLSNVIPAPLKRIALIQPIPDDSRATKRLAMLVIGLGFAVRLFRFYYTAIINPDGPLYIHQARAIYYGLFDSLVSCSRDFVSNYPIFTAGAYAFLRNWEVAAQSVSLAFGTLTLIPVYFLFKRIFSERISVLTTLILALMPVFIDRSVDVVRAPVFWFFSVLGFYFFVSQIYSRKNLYLLVSSLSFLMAIWARVEGILFVVVSAVYILAGRQEKKLESFVIFILPFVLLAMVAMSVLNVFRHESMISYVRSSVAGYESIRVSLQELISQSPDSLLTRFFRATRNLTWWVALGTLMRSAVKAFFYPFFLVFIIGFKGIWEKIRQDRRISYLSFLCISAFFFLYAVVLIIWEMPTRYMGVFILPALIFIGSGLETIRNFFRYRFSLKDSLVFPLVCALILAFSLPKVLQPREADKAVFKQIGSLIAEREGNNMEILVAASHHSIRWIAFYANVGLRGAPCPEKNYDLEYIIGSSHKEFVQNLRARGIRYVLWEENHWPEVSARYLGSQNPRDFIRVGAWSHPDTGKMILFRVTE